MTYLFLNFGVLLNLEIFIQFGFKYQNLTYPTSAESIITGLPCSATVVYVICC